MKSQLGVSSLTTHYHSSLPSSLARELSVWNCQLVYLDEYKKKRKHTPKRGEEDGTPPPHRSVVLAVAHPRRLPG